MWDTARDDLDAGALHLSHDPPCPRCDHSGHRFLPCDRCECDGTGQTTYAGEREPEHVS